MSEKIKFKRHSKRDPEWYSKRMMEDMNTINDLKLLAVLSGSYMDYLLNELIISWFEQPKIIIDDIDYTFDKKLNLLIAVGFWRNADDLLFNVKQLNSIRNYYAHNILEEQNSIPENIKQRIDSIKYKFPEGNISYEGKFKIGVVGCLSHLMSVSNHFKNL